MKRKEHEEKREKINTKKSSNIFSERMKENTECNPPPKRKK